MVVFFPIAGATDTTAPLVSVAFVAAPSVSFTCVIVIADGALATAVSTANEVLGAET